MKIQPYLNFDGHTEAAFTFYQSVLGGQVIINKMKDMPNATDSIPENELERVIHAILTLENGAVIMASDTLPSAGHELHIGNHFYLSLNPNSKTDANRIFEGLSKNGTVEMPLQDTFWAAYYGSFKDQYGIRWMINCETE